MIRLSGQSLGWAALLAAGQAATLAMVHAGNLVGYQHYIVPWRLAAEAPAWALLVFAAELVSVSWGLRRHLPALRRSLHQAGRWRMAALAIGFVLTGATLSREVTHYAAELAFASLVQLVHLGALSLFALSLGEAALGDFGAVTDRILGPSSDVTEPGGPDRFAWVLAGCVAAVAVVLALFSYQRHPHVPDEVVYLLQANYLAAGHLTLPLPAVPSAFNVDLLTYQADRWFSPVPPGWPFILAIGSFMGLPWLVNPLLGGLNVLLANSVLRELYPRRTARLATLLFAASPWHLFMSMNLMTHTATLSAALLASLAVARMRRGYSLWWAVAGGTAIGVVGLIRPLEGVAVALLLGAWSLKARGRWFRLAPSTVLTGTAIAVGALVLPYNAHLTGSARTFPIMAYTDAMYGPGTNSLGFGTNRGLGWPGLDPLPGHGPLDVLINANFNLFQTNTELLGWATGSLFLLLALCTVGRLRRPDGAMLAVIAMIAGIHSFYYFSGGPDFGARYWYLLIVPCVALTARGIEACGGWVDVAHGGEGRRVLAGAVMLSLTTLLIFVPWRATDKYFHYRGMRPDARQLSADPALRDGMVLVRGHRHPDFASAVVYNSPDLASHSPLFVWDRDPATRRELAAAYPARHFWVVDGPSLTGDGYRVVAGPLRADQLLGDEAPPPPAPGR